MATFSAGHSSTPTNRSNWVNCNEGSLSSFSYRTGIISAVGRIASTFVPFCERQPSENRGNVRTMACKVASCPISGADQEYKTNILYYEPLPWEIIKLWYLSSANRCALRATLPGVRAVTQCTL